LARSARYIAEPTGFALRSAKRQKQICELRAFGEESDVDASCGASRAPAGIMRFETRLAMQQLGAPTPNDIELEMAPRV
jgi:hypothetical protein